MKASILTPAGEILVRLFPDRAPLSAGSFLAHADAGLYHGASFYRACRPDTETFPDQPAVLLQGGLGFSDPSPLARIAHEGPLETGLMPDRGTIALARLGPGTACSEFFFNLADNLSMRPGGGRGDGLGVAVFGMIEMGIEVADLLVKSPAGTKDEAYPEPVRPQILVPPVPILAIQRA